MKHYPLATWLSFERDYIKGLGTVDEIASKYSVNLETARSRATKEKWGVKRKKYLDRKAQETESPVEPEPVKERITSNSRIGTLEQQIELVDNAISSAFFARDVADLVKAKATLEDMLFVAINGMKPGTMKPSRQKQRGSNASPIPIPEPLPLVVDDNSQAA